MDTPRRPAEPGRETRLFVLRLWAEDMGGGRSDWRGSIRHLATGEARYFRDWPTMEAFVDGVLGGAEGLERSGDLSGRRRCAGTAGLSSP